MFSYRRSAPQRALHRRKAPACADRNQGGQSRQRLRTRVQELAKRARPVKRRALCDGRACYLGPPSKGTACARWPPGRTPGRPCCCRPRRLNRATRPRSGGAWALPKRHPTSCKQAASRQQAGPVAGWCEGAWARAGSPPALQPASPGKSPPATGEISHRFKKLLNLQLAQAVLPSRPTCLSSRSARPRCSGVLDKMALRRPCQSISESLMAPPTSEHRHSNIESNTNAAPPPVLVAGHTLVSKKYQQSQPQRTRQKICNFQKFPPYPGGRQLARW